MWPMSVVMLQTHNTADYFNGHFVGSGLVLGIVCRLLQPYSALLQLWTVVLAIGERRGLVAIDKYTEFDGPLPATNEQCLPSRRGHDMVNLSNSRNVLRRCRRKQLVHVTQQAACRLGID